MKEREKNNRSKRAERPSQTLNDGALNGYRACPRYQFRHVKVTEFMAGPGLGRQDTPNNRYLFEEALRWQTCSWAQIYDDRDGRTSRVASFQMSNHFGDTPC